MHALDILKRRSLRLLNTDEGQDMVEYALLAGFIAIVAGALLPDISVGISTIFSKMQSVVSASAAT
jgi:Flp pilus assembly pilin Flp